MTVVYTRLAACMRNVGRPMTRISRHNAPSSFMSEKRILNFVFLLKTK